MTRSSAAAAQKPVGAARVFAALGEPAAQRSLGLLSARRDEALMRLKALTEGEEG